MPKAFGRILVPVDGSEVAEKAAQKALALAKSLDTKVVVMHVINIDLYAYQTELVYPTEIPLQELFQKEGHAYLDEIVTLGEEMGVTVSEKLVEGHPAEEIIQEAHEDDLIVMGSKGRTGLDRLLLGSVAENVARHASCPVMIVK
jgi:nucleotide-binding universal stress UspA family protein